MPQLGLAGGSGSLDNINISQSQFRDQIAAMVDMVRQVIGDANVAIGSTAAMDPLSAPFTLYVNPYTGSDKFVGGSYNSYEAPAGSTDEEKIAAKLKRLEKQRMVCGYTPQRPFKTINRAVIEAAIITSKNWYTYTDPRAHLDCVSIILAPGVHVAYNNPGNASSSLPAWGAEKSPTVAELISFNPVEGGILLPRGCSLCGLDLRKVTIRPNWVPAVADENADYSNRRSIFKITGTGYFFGATTMDKVGEARSHHLLDVFHFASKSELDLFYAKCFTTVGTSADLSSALTATRKTEYEIVGPIDTVVGPTESWDTTASASPYIFNWSVRSDYGMGGAFIDGSKVSGLKSTVIAQFTGVSLQKDMSCWQRYSNGAWGAVTYPQYIESSPDNIRMNPARLSRHISAINDAFIQEVSVFAIGHGIHHFTDKGGEITITNSNSSFGGCASLSKGYKSYAFPNDRNWKIDSIIAPLDIRYKIGNIETVYLGVIDSVSSGSSAVITLQLPLAASPDSEDVPQILLERGYTLRSGTLIWVENPSGEPWRGTLSSSAWDTSDPSKIRLSDTLVTSDLGDEASVPEGKRIYIRRIVDTRTPSERRTSIILENTASSRLPQVNFVIQTDPLRVGGAIARELLDTGSEVLVVTSSGVSQATGGAEITIRRGAAPNQYSSGSFYPAGSVVRYAQKHWQTSKDVKAVTAAPDPLFWSETFVHMASDYNPEDSIKQESRIITIDTDTDVDPYSQTLGISWPTFWSTASDARNQYRSSTDYMGVHALLVAMGLSASTAHEALLPRAEGSREIDPASSIDFPQAPSGGAASGRGKWAVEFRRPSVLRLYGHAWEWSGFLNYSKSIPAAQQDLSPQNKFSYYFTHEDGGRVVPQGSNEDGFNVSPRGLENVETGATLTVENIGSSSVDQSQQTSFDSLTAGSITVTNLTVKGTLTTSTTVAKASVSQQGVISLAGSRDLYGQRRASFDAAIELQGKAVTPYYLNAWKTQNRLVSQRTAATVIYVDPVNGRDESNIEVLLLDPPTSYKVGSATKALKSIRVAANYANTVLSSSETAEFRCAPGVYLDYGTITFNMITRIRAWDPTTSSYLSNSSDGGTSPFMQNANGSVNYQKFRDVRAQPIFLTRPQVGNIANSSPQIFSVTFLPLKFAFNQDALVTGVAWWGIHETLTRSDVPDSFFEPTSTYSIAANSSASGNWRQLARTSYDNAVNYYLRDHIVAIAPTDGHYRFYGIRSRCCMEFNSTGSVRNVAIGAIMPADDIIRGESTNSGNGVIELSDKLVTISGLYLFGNCKVSSELNTGTTYSNIRIRSSEGTYTTQNYFINGFCTNLFACGGIGSSISLAFTARKSTGTPGQAIVNYNFPCNNVHLVNTDTANPQPASNTSDVTAQNWRQLGPALTCIFDRFGSISRAYQTRNWSQFWVSTTGSAGFVGKFGRYTTIYTAALSGGVQLALGNGNALVAHVRTTGLTPDVTSVAGDGGVSFNSFGSDTETTIFRVAGVSNGVPPISTTSPTSTEYGKIGAFTNFDDLNIRVRTIRVGVDVASSVSASENMVL